MVAQLLRLKLRLLGNIFRRSTWQVVGIVVGLIYGLGAAVFAFVVLTGLRGADDVALVRDASWWPARSPWSGFLLVPLVFGIDDTMDPRRFSLFGIADRTLALGLALAAMIGVPALALAIALSGTVVTWSRGVGETLLALVAAPLAFATCLLGARITAGLGGLLLETRRSRDVAGVIGVLLIVMAAPLLVGLSTVDWAASGRRAIAAIAGANVVDPARCRLRGARRRRRGRVGHRHPEARNRRGDRLDRLDDRGAARRPHARDARARGVRSRYHGLGWFGRMPHGATGAIAARSITYWFRDARYWVSLVMVPITPILVAVPLGIAGVPAMYLGLIPVPLVCLLRLEPAQRHRVRQHGRVAARRVGRAGRRRPDRAARARAHLGDPRDRPRQRGDGVRPRRLAAAAVAARREHGAPAGRARARSITSAAMPYPVVKPGDSPFQARSRRAP